MSQFALSPRAKADVFEIWSFIAEDSEDAADRVEAAIYDACSALSQGFSLGHPRRDLTNRPLRFWTVVRYPNYMIVYLPDSKPLQVIAVVHGRRSLKKLLRQR